MAATIETAELLGRELDYWVLRAEGGKPVPRPEHWTCEGKEALQVGEGADADLYCVACQLPSYSEHWDSNGLRLIEKHRIRLMPEDWSHFIVGGDGKGWFARKGTLDYEGYGPTPLIAAMRCIVGSKYGAVIDRGDAPCK